MTIAGRQIDLKNYAIAFAMLVVLCGLALTGRMKIADQLTGKQEDSKADITLVSPYEHDFQPIRADITNDSASRFTIDVENFANIGVDEDAAVFAVYTDSYLPDDCGDFRGLKLDYKKPSKYERQFNLSRHKDVLEAIETYGCVVITNGSATDKG
jgi:hypothetical protein